MKKKNIIPEEFNEVLGSVFGNADTQEETTIITDDMLESENDFDEDDKNTPVDTKKKDLLNTEDKDNKGNVEEDNTDIPADVLQRMLNQDKDPDEENEDVTEDDVHEAQLIGLLFDAVGESFGWDMADIKDEERPLTVDDLTKFLKNVVEQNSVPHYADERVQMLDEYVKNGGKFEDFYQVQQSMMSFDNLDMEDENNQKSVIRELLKYDGYTDEQINKRILRYEDADMLVEESEDALERLKAIRTKEIEENSRLQKEYALEQEQRSRQFLEDVMKNINQLTTIRGIAIPKEDRQALFDYIFKVDKNGISQYQKDFNANLSKNLIESAYFTMKADTLLKGAKQQGETSAAEKLREMLRHSSKNHTSYNADERKQKSVVDLATGLF